MTSLNAVTPKLLLKIDAVTCGAMALLLLAGAGPLGDWLDLPVAFLRTVGAALVPWTALLALLGLRQQTPRWAMLDVIAVNLVWVAGSVLLLVGGWLDPNGFGVAFIIVQAVAVLILAAIQAETLDQAGDARSRVAQA